MKKYFFSLLFLFIASLHSCAQQLPVIRATSKTVDVLDGNNFQKGIWHISPDVKPDIYYASRTKQPKRVAFYTDIDSLSFVVEANKEYGFVILLNGKDSAYTTVSTFSNSAFNFTKKNGRSLSVADTLPFRLGKGDKIYIKGSINNSVALDFMFDTGSDQEVISKSGLSKNVALHFNDVKSSVTLGGTTTIQSSSGNRLQIGNLIWDNLPIAQIDEADADGIIGYNVFDNKIVEINYDKKILVVHTQPVTIDAGYEKLPLVFKGNLPFVEAVLATGGKVIKDYFEFDAGSNGSLWLNKDFANEKGLYGAMKKLSETSSRGLDGNKIWNERVVLPALRFGKYSLANVPVDLELPSESANLKWGILGMDILKRYNTVLDLQADNVYLRPNGLIATPFHKPLNEKLFWVGLIVVAVLLVTVAIVYKKQRAKQTRNVSINKQVV